MGLCLDENRGHAGPGPVPADDARHAERRSRDYGRHGVTGLFAAFNIADGTVISELPRQHRAVERAHLGKEARPLDEAVPRPSFEAIVIKGPRRAGRQPPA